MAVDLQHPGQVGGHGGGDLLERAGELVELLAAGVADRVGGAVEQHLAGEHEAVADNLHVVALAQHLAQAAEEFGAVARQFAGARGQRQVELLAEFVELQILVADRGLGGAEGVVEFVELGAQRGELAVEQLHLRNRALRQFGLFLERGAGGVERAGEARGLRFELGLEALQRGDVVDQAGGFFVAGEARRFGGVEFELQRRAGLAAAGERGGQLAEL